MKARDVPENTAAADNRLSANTGWPPACCWTSTDLRLRSVPRAQEDGPLAPEPPAVALPAPVFIVCRFRFFFFLFVRRVFMKHKEQCEWASEHRERTREGDNYSLAGNRETQIL